jgi:hypothetical protein
MDAFKRTGAGDFSKFLKVLISGPPKSGKTTLLGTVPNILVLDTEPHANNLESIAHLDVPYRTITSTEDLRDTLMILANPSLRQQLAQGTYGIPDIGAVAIDTMDTLQKIMKAERLKEERKSQFLRDDWGWLKTEMEKIVEGFTALPMHVFFVVHTKTQEVGKGEESYTVVLPGLEGAISQSIAGMVGYSLLSFRREEVDKATGQPVTKYYLRTEGDSAHDFLGTRTGGRLPTVIEPDMATIYKTVMANRPNKPAAQATPPPAVPQQPAENSEQVAQTASQPEQVQTPVQTESQPETPVQQPESSSTPATPPAEKPDNQDPVTPAALGHVKKVFDAVGVAMVDEHVKTKTMGEAREMVKMWRAILQDHQEGKSPEASPQAEMLTVLRNFGWLTEEEKAPEQPKQVTPKIDGTIDEVMAYVTKGGDGADLELVQEAYEKEMAKGEDARKSLISKLESLGAKPPTAVQTGGETQPEPVTSQETGTDSPPTAEEAQKAVEEELGGEVISVEEGIREGAPCDIGGDHPVDDIDLAELGMKRFNKVLCVEHYLAEQRS